MKAISLRWVLLSGLTFLLGIAAGAVLQKTVGVGNVLRTIGIPYPTSAPQAGAAVLPVVDVPAADRDRMALFVLAGQSNMVGWAPLPEEQATDPRIYVFGNDYHWRIASEPVDNAYNQVDQVSLDRIAFFGPSLAFGFESLVRQPQVVIGLIPCAKNSSAIGQWQRDTSDQSLYGSCLKRVRAASAMGKISGILFFQGEADALDPERFTDPAPNPSNWSELFTAFVTDFRNDTGESELPVVFAQLGANASTGNFPNWNVVKEQQRSVQLPMTAMITTDDLPLLDGLHFTVESYRIIGQRFANAYWDLVEQAPIQ